MHVPDHCPFIIATAAGKDNVSVLDLHILWLQCYRCIASNVNFRLKRHESLEGKPGADITGFQQIRQYL